MSKPPAEKCVRCGLAVHEYGAACRTCRSVDPEVSARLSEQARLDREAQDARMHRMIHRKPPRGSHAYQPPAHLPLPRPLQGNSLHPRSRPTG